MRETTFCIARGVFAALVLLAFSCDKTAHKDFLGSAVVEARTYAVSTTAQGVIVAMHKDEGQNVKKDELLAIIDTVQLTFKQQEVRSHIKELMTTISAKQAEIKGLVTDVAGAEREYTRIDELVKKGSATEQQRDKLGTAFQSTQMRLVAARRVHLSLKEKENGLRVKLEELDDQVRRCYVRSPANGIVLTRYRNIGEVVAPGNPIMEIGEFDSLYADFFVPQAVLASISYNQKLRIRLDFDDGATKDKEKFFPARVIWIGNEAEFSPKNIQTRQSRNELVFRVRAEVDNREGSLKRGLPVEVWR
ncbi:MAG: efflux RND transporter periplasmic adaptor subunit [Chitinispirillaceae bacterium]|nr:efflux RND transporter periplasmic adaptor subunit [Chitinispirillaceae bacterium]